MKTILAIAVGVALAVAPPAGAAYLTMKEAKQIVRKGARRYVEAFDADGYRIRRCGRQSPTRILCKVRIIGVDYGSYSCDVFVGVTLRSGVIRSRLVESYC